MSSIRKRNGKYQAQVRINGASVTRSFRTKSEASSWSRQQEARLETRKASGYKPSSFADILQRYLKDVTPLKRNTSFEPGVINMFLKEAWAHKPIDQISVSEIAEAIVFLASSRARYITGQCLAADGGFESTGVGLPALRE